MTDHLLEKGIVQTPYGFRTYVRVRGSLLTKRWPPTATLPQMRGWRDDLIRVHRGGQKSSRGLLVAEIDRYLAAVSSMPTLVDRTRDLHAWIPTFGQRARLSITPLELQTALHAWRASGLAASTCNHRRSALSHLFTTLDGKDAYNPLRAVPTFAEPKATKRGIPLFAVRRIFRHMPASRTKARLELLAWTGMRPRELMRLSLETIDLRHRCCRIQTAKGGPLRDIPLNGSAVAAARRFIALGGWGDFSLASARKSLHLACRKAGIPAIRIYDLRHSFGSALRQSGTDLADIQEHLGHSSAELTLRYAPAVSEKLRQAVNRVG